MFLESFGLMVCDVVHNSPKDCSEQRAGEISRCHANVDDLRNHELQASSYKQGNRCNGYDECLWFRFAQ